MTPLPKTSPTVGFPRLASTLLTLRQSFLQDQTCRVDIIGTALFLLVSILLNFVAEEIEFNVLGLGYLPESDKMFWDIYQHKFFVKLIVMAVRRFEAAGTREFTLSCVPTRR